MQTLPIEMRHPLLSQMASEVKEETADKANLSDASPEGVEGEKKLRKRRRLKGEEPRDAALRRFNCPECGSKFARPS